MNHSLNTTSKFHQSYKYQDTSMGIMVEFTIKIINEKVVGMFKTSHQKFPPVTIMMDGMEPTGLNEIEEQLRKDLEMKKIKDLSFGRQMCVSEINNKCVEIGQN